MAFRSGLTQELIRLRFDHVKVDLGKGIVSNAMELADMGDTMQKDTHGDLELRSGQADARDRLGGGMLHSETRVQLQEVKIILGVIV